jgi:hypothetical protein
MPTFLTERQRRGDGAVLEPTDQEQPSRRFVAGADAVGIAKQKVADLQEQIDAWRHLSTSLAPFMAEVEG